MKTLLATVIILAVALILWVRYVSVRPTDTHRAIIAGLKEELQTAENEKLRLSSELAVAEREITRLGGSHGSDEFAHSAATDPTGSAGVTGTAPSASPGFAPGKDRLKAIFDENTDLLNREQESIELLIATTEESKKRLLDTPLTFSEQSTVIDVDGAVVGNRGVRTSQADRDRITKLRREEVAALDAKLTECRDKLDSISARKRLLDTQYRAALVRAGEPATGPVR